MSVIDDMISGSWPADVTDPGVQAALDAIGDTDTIIKIPGLPPIVGEAGDVVGILFNLQAIIAALTAEVSYIPILNVILLILDLILALLPIFEGRPREEATLNCATNLLKAKNSAAIIAGNNIQRLYTQFNIVISASGSEQKLIGAVVNQFVNNLVGQGIEKKLAQQIVLYQFTDGADNLGRIWPFLQEAVEPGTSTFGPAGLQRVFGIVDTHFLDLGQTPAKAEEHTWQLLLQNLPLKWLFQVYLGSEPGQPPPGTCQPGYHWAPTANNGAGACVKNFTKMPPPPPWTPPPGTPPLGQPDPEGDEITNTLCQQNADNALAVIYTLNQLLQQMQQGDNADCCTQITTAITAITTALNAIAAALPGLAPPAPTINFAPVVNVEVPPAPPPTITVDAPPTDVSAVVKAINDWTAHHDLPDSSLQALINTGAVPPELAALYQGLDPDAVAAYAAHLVGYILGVGLKEAVDIVDRIFTFIVKPFAGVIWKVLTDIVEGFNIGDGTAINKIANAATSIVTALDKAITTVFGGAAKLVLEGYESGISGIDTTTDAGVSKVIQILLGRALELGMGAHILAVLPELAYFTKELGLNATAALLAELAGFHEVMIQVHRPFMTAAIGRPAQYSFNRKFPTALPAGNTALALWARRKLSDVDRDHLTASSGFSPAYLPALEAGAYRPISPRQLATLIADQPFDTPQMRAILEDNSYSPGGVNFMLRFLEYNSTKTLRNSYIGELITAYKDGVVGDDEVQSTLEGIGWSTAAITLVKQRAALQRRVTLAQEAAKWVIPEITAGLLTSDAGLAQLEAAGYQDWFAQLLVTNADAHALITLTRKEAAAEAKLELARQRNLTKAAIAEYQRGVLDEAGLTAALIAIGLDPTLVASTVAVQDATRTGRLRLTYGQLLLPQDAKILKDRVTAIEDQFKKELLTLDQARAQLQGLNVDAPELDALLATWAAELAAATTHGYLVNPLTGVKS